MSCERVVGEPSFEKTLLLEGEPIAFTLYSLTPNGALESREITDVFKKGAKGQFRGDVWLLQNNDWVIKTAWPTRSKYGVPLRFLRSLNEGFRPFLPQYFETVAQMEFVGQKIIKLLTKGYFGDKYYVPEAIGYSFLSGTGFCQVIEQIDFKNPHLPEEIKQIFEAQEELTGFYQEAGLVEFSGQIHENNPLAPGNLVLLKKGQEEKKQVCILDTLPGMQMRESGYIPPVFSFSHQRQICRQTKEEGEPLPAFNRIHVRKTKAFIHEEENWQRIVENIGPEGWQNLEKWLGVYEMILTDYDQIRDLSRKEQWLEALRESPDVPLSVVEKVEESDLLYLLASVFGIKAVGYLLDETYRAWVNEGFLLAERRQEGWQRFKKKKTLVLRQGLRIGPEQELDTDLSFGANFLASKTLIVRPWMQRLVVDPDFRHLEEVTRYFVLPGVRKAKSNRIISAAEFKELEEAVSLENLGLKKLIVYLTTFLGQQAIARAADVFEIGNYAAAFLDLNPKHAAVGFLGGWVAPVFARFLFIKLMETISQEDLSIVEAWNWLPKVGHYIGVLDQIRAAAGNLQVRDLIIRSRVADMLSLWPTSGWGTKSELKAWFKIATRWNLCSNEEN